MSSLRHSLPLLNALVAFEAAARHGSVTRAAEELFVSQSVVSRHVANLERQSGLQLFRRSARRVEVTDAGRQLATAVAFGLGHVRDVLDALRQRPRHQRLTIASSYDLAFLWLMPRFASLRALVPDTELRLVTSDSYLDFDAPDNDLSLRFGRGRWPGARAVKLFGEAVFPVCAPALLAELPSLRRAMRPAELARAPLLALAPQSSGGLDWTSWFKAAGAAPPSPVATFTSYTVLLQAALTGKGVALAWAHLLDEYLDSGRLVRLTSQVATSRFGFYLVVREEREAEVRALIASLCETPVKRAARP